jgi:membrane-bound metal-dependent hydrolase YbcI (DUF457 family)
VKLPEHVAISFLLAQLGPRQEYGTTGTLLMLLAGILPDLDGLTLLAGWRAYRTYHRICGHGLLVTLLGPPLLAWLGTTWLNGGNAGFLWAWLQVSLLAHLFTDVCFYRWPVQLLWPFSARAWGFGLLRWNDLVPTLCLYAASAGVLLWPARAVAIATAGLVGFLLYLAWRTWRPPSRSGLSAWLAGGWTEHHARFWRWLTGDFVTR